MDHNYVDEDMNESSTGIIDKVFYVVENYGWYLLAVCIIFVIIYNKIVKRHIDNYLEKYKQHKFDQEYSAKYHKNPDLFAAHVNAQQHWVDKMQEKYNKESEKYQKKIKEREEKKLEYMEKYSQEGGHVLGGKKDENDSNNLRPDYNPLMGGGSSSTYRPPRRSPCGGGGCGR